MTNPDIQQAKEWARDNLEGGYFHGGDRALAAAEVIQSLPDHIIDAEKLRKVIAEIRSEYPPNTAGHQLCSGLAKQLEALLSPPLQTLADLVEQGNDPQSYQWMQAQVFSTDPTLGIITGVDGYSRSAIILFTDGMAKNVPWAFITPLPGESKFEWPGSHADTITAESVEDTPIVDGEPTPPRPEDVPPGKPWIVKFDGHEWVGTRESRVEIVCSWALVRLDGADYTVASDDDITLVSRLVPEVTQ